MSPNFTFPVNVRYMEVDAQGVVFNAWYFTYFDDAMTAFLAHGGLPYRTMLDAGFDVQLVGRTSFTLDFEVRRGSPDDPEVTTFGRTVYVVVATDGSGKREIPALLRAALGEVRPLGPAQPRSDGSSPGCHSAAAP